jgi:octaprenyl-diphosphate synthase
MTTAPVPAVALPLAPLLSRCEARLQQAVSGGAAEVVRPALDTLAAGGKRVRPLLVFCAAPRGALADPAATQGLLSAAAAVELVHMATLVHDDLLDGATMRRGRPTVAQELGAERAVGTGDFLFARAFAELTRTRSARAVQALAAAALDLSRGEMDQQRAAFDLTLGEEAYLARCRRKTAALFSVACRLGALVGGGGREAEDRLAAFGENVGMAFQIFDDILDLAGAPAATGKRRGTDLCDGTVTLPVILALRLEPSLRPHVADACQGPALEQLCDRLAAHPGLDLARERALEFVAAARRAVDEGPTGGADVAALREIADGVVDRYS